MTLEQLTKCLEREFQHWDHLYQYGGQDPFFEDGCNLNLVRNHIFAFKRDMERFMEKESQELTLFASSYPDIYYRETPPEVSNDYMARADEIRARARQQMALYENDPNFCYIRDHHHEVFPGGESTRATKAAGLHPATSGQTLWFRKYLEQDDLLSLRRAFYTPYEKKAPLWAEHAQKMKDYLCTEHSQEDITPVREEYEDEDCPETSCDAPDGPFGDEQETEPPAAPDSPRAPSLAEQIQNASSRAGDRTTSAPAREEQITFF